MLAGTVTLMCFAHNCASVVDTDNRCFHVTEQINRENLRNTATSVRFIFVFQNVDSTIA